MNKGFLSEYFQGYGAKRLTDVEISSEKSHQHEFNGISELKNIFGTEKIIFSARYVYLNDNKDEVISDEGSLTWYDARKGHPTRTEFRLYYSENSVLKKAESGDLIIICKKSNDTLFIIIAPKGTTIENQILWLFGLNEDGNKFLQYQQLDQPQSQLSMPFFVKDLEHNKLELLYGGKYILSELGIEIKDEAADFLEDLLNKFGNEFPKTSDFSEYARNTSDSVSIIEDPDQALVVWMEHEERLFKTLERFFLEQKLKKGFGESGYDPDDFISFSLSVQNRRKSRAGWAFENHLLHLFKKSNLFFSKGVKTERNNKPDFIFPDIKFYNDPSFPQDFLTMLGVKTTAKDRWRQILSEADRIKEKHLITLQPAISKNQTDEMHSQHVHLVMPSSLIKSYSQDQQKHILSLRDFIELLKDRQKIL